jgi:hypothetical protein
MLQVNTIKDKTIISIDNKIMSKTEIYDFLKRIEFEFIINSSDFDDEVSTVADDIQSEWWKEDKAK